MQLQADLEKTMNDCDARLEEVRKTVQFWSRYGEDEVRSAIQEAEAACDGAKFQFLL